MKISWPLSAFALFAMWRLSSALLVSRRAPVRNMWLHQRANPFVGGTRLFLSTTEQQRQEQQTGDEKSIDSTWNVPGLKKEVGRLILRCHKKIGKASARVTSARETVERLTADDTPSLEELGQCPNLDELEADLKSFQERLQNLNQLETSLSAIKKKSAVLPTDLAQLALSLEVNDTPPQRPARGPSKQKGPRVMTSTRKPYRRYYSENHVEIRVGKKAEDNDELSTSPNHRDGNDWWMHASGCPGSHVVIRSPQPSKAVLQDAAALAARQSKCTGSVIKVSLCLCRDVKKPSGAKPGLVQLTGNVRTIAVNMKEAAGRLERLEETCLVN